ncbi:hypothetical protein KC336_g21432, partial [Hortaea werneckii]
MSFVHNIPSLVETLGPGRELFRPIPYISSLPDMSPHRSAQTVIKTSRPTHDHSHLLRRAVRKRPIDNLTKIRPTYLRINIKPRIFLALIIAREQSL